MNQAENPSKGSVVTVGTFDGVHRGHREVLRLVAQEAESMGLRPLAVTFDRHPLEVIAPSKAPARIMPAAESVRLMRREGVDVDVIPFESVRGLTACEWIDEMKRRYGVRVLILGYDNRFGRDGRDLSLDDYERLGREAGICVERAPEVAGYSSSAVRRAVEAGDMERARSILGRRFTVSGTVVHGRAMGRRFGVPTANLSADPRQLLPLHGVYAAIARIPGVSKWHKAVVNIGRCPTVTDGQKSTVEVHLLDFSQDIYGKELEVAFDSRVRDERRFDSVEELLSQIKADMSEVAAKNIAIEGEE